MPVCDETAPITITLSVSDGTTTKELITYNNKTVARVKVYTATLNYGEIEANTPTNKVKALFTNGGSLTLTENVTLDEALTLVSGKEVTLDLGGKILTLSEEATSTASDDITNNGTLTIKNGTIVSANTAIASYGNLTLIDCNVSTSNKDVNVIGAVGGTLTIEGGEYKNTATETPANAVYVIAVVNAEATINADVKVSSDNQGAITVHSSTATINGGTYEGGNWHALYIYVSTVIYKNAIFETSNSWSDIFVKVKDGKSSTVNETTCSTDTQINQD